MKKVTPTIIKLAFNMILGLMLFFISPGANAQDFCEIGLDQGEGYSTNISSVTDNGNGSYTIVLVVANNGCSGCKKLNHYSVEADSGTYSDISVELLSGNFTFANIDYGPNLGGDPFEGFRVNNANGMGNGQAASFSITYTITGALQDQRVLAKAASDDLILTFSAEDFQSVLDCQSQNIFPYYDAPEDGKVYDIIGSELTSLYYVYFENGTYISDDIFQIVGASVYVEILVQNGQYNAALALLTQPSYGLTSYVGNEAQLTISGLFPILNLLSLNELPTLLVQVRPVYTALGNAGIVTSQGDTSLRSYLARTGYSVSGQGIKIGVMSDSYNTLLGDPASDDVLRGDLPGIANADNPIPVDVLLDYPYGSRTDEGRAMMHIVHDIAPGAGLAFRTGFLGAVDFATGILELQQAGCDIIVDDITYISEPFFRDGIVARAVDSVASLGLTYFSAAGNFGAKAYQSDFYPVAAPAGIIGEAHNFAGSSGGTDIYQSITVAPGNYTVVLQWDDGTPGNYTNSDFDIYLSRENGATLFGFNRVNTGAAPLEVLPFTVVDDTAQTNFMIIRESGSGPAILKYIVFRGDIQVNEYATSSGSTLVGQANAAGAIAVGAVLFSNTPEFGVDPPTAASFSSRGGTPVDGINRNKPDIMAPNGVNTNVDLGGFNIDGDIFPNFFGTSAAAPHAAGVAALILEARQKYYGTNLSPELLKGVLQNTAIDMYAPGYDPVSGAGFIQADAALGTLANPSPYITGIYYDTTLIPGIDPIEIIVYGQFLTDESVIFFNGDTLENVTIVLGDTAVSSTIPAFSERYPMIQVYNPPMAGTNGTDGGLSNPLYFTTKETIVVSIDDKTKKYGEMLPGFTAQYFVEDINGVISLDSAGLSQEETDRIQGINFETVATALSNTGFWEIVAGSNDPLNPESGLPVTDSLDQSILERYNIDFESGILTVEKIDLVITPRDTVITYGDSVGSFNYDFSFNNDSVNLEFGLEIEYTDSLAILSAMRSGYATALVNGAALVFATALVNESNLVNKSMMIPNATFNKFATALVNGTFIGGPSFATATALVNVVSFTGSSVMAPATALVNGEVVVNSYDSTGALVNALSLNQATALVNAFGGATALVNTNTVNGNSNSDAIFILGGEDISILAGDSTGYLEMKGISLFTGNTVGQHYILPGTFVSNNFNISYGLGSLTVLPDTAVVVINAADLSQAYDGTVKTVSVTTIPAGLNVVVSYDSLTTGPVNAGSYTVNAVVGDPNYVGEATATLVISPATATVTADLKWIYDGDPLPDFTATFSGFTGTDDETVVDSLSFTVNPQYYGEAGTYQIIPYATAANYTFTSVNGTLYVNPDSPGTKQIKPRLICVEELTVPDSSGFLFIANYEYLNDNATDIYIPIGEDNYFSGDANYNAINQPEIFLSGGGTFTVPFDGEKLIWTVKSYKNNGQKGAVASNASSKSSRCNKSAEAQADDLQENTSGEIVVYPNPTSGKITLVLNGNMVSGDDVIVYDIYGKAQALNAFTASDALLELDLSAYAAGIYFVRINTAETVQVSRVIKK